MEYLSTIDEVQDVDAGEISKNDALRIGDALHIGEAITVHDFQYDVPIKSGQQLKTKRQGRKGNEKD
tara:strand:+ start:89 stop:289 length:201 start_codon:yes stop_codon:yes gene_type:complete